MRETKKMKMMRETNKRNVLQRRERDKSSLILCNLNEIYKYASYTREFKQFSFFICINENLQRK